MDEVGGIKKNSVLGKRKKEHKRVTKPWLCLRLTTEPVQHGTGRPAHS